MQDKIKKKANNPNFTLFFGELVISKIFIAKYATSALKMSRTLYFLN
jgi:hypothetical protein